MNYHLVRDNPQFREVIFKAHITQMSIASYFQTDEEQLNAAIKMANSSLFSQSYWVSGNKKIKQLTDEGYAPAQVVYADMLIRLRPEHAHINITNSRLPKIINQP